METLVRRRAGLIAIAAAITTASSCFFDFERADELAPGTVRGRAMFQGQPVPGAILELLGEGRRRVTADDGTFLLGDVPAGSWSLRVVRDEDGDGIPEAVAQRTVTLHWVTPPEGLFGEGEPGPAGVQLGDVELDDVGELRGRVRGTDGQPLGGARVAVFRTVDLQPALTSARALPAAAALAPVEHLTTTDADGSWRAPGIAPGAVQVAAFGFSGTLEPRVSEPLDAAVVAGVSLELPTIVADLTFATTTATLWVFPDVGPLDVVAQRPGLARPEGSELGSGRSLEWTQPFDDSLVLGFHDIHLLSRDDVGIGPQGEVLAETWRGVLPGVLVSGAVTLGPVRLWDPNDGPCGPVDATDCDGDGVPSLPWRWEDGHPAATDLDVWSRCAGQCGAAFGTTGASECLVDGNPFDCDDDADGQPDVTEPPACLGLAGGRDSDGDGVCDVSDTFPWCRENDPAAAACAADAAPDPFARPRVRPEYGGPAIPVDAGPDDAGFDAGVTDAGPTDTGPSDAGVLDAGTDGG